MRRILVVDADLQARLAKCPACHGCVARAVLVHRRDPGWRRQRHCRAERGHVRSCDRRRIRTDAERLRIDQGASRPSTDESEGNDGSSYRDHTSRRLLPALGRQGGDHLLPHRLKNIRPMMIALRQMNYSTDYSLSGFGELA